MTEILSVCLSVSVSASLKTWMSLALGTNCVFGPQLVVNGLFVERMKGEPPGTSEGHVGLQSWDIERKNSLIHQLSRSGGCLLAQSKGLKKKMR